MSNNIADNRNAQSMQIILHAGNAREAYTKALDLAESGNFCDADSLLKEAETELTQGTSSPDTYFAGCDRRRRSLYSHPPDPCAGYDDEH